MQQNKKIFTDQDLKNICKYLLIDYNTLISKNKIWTLAFQRVILINYIKSNYDNTLKSLGKLFGNRDHSTIYAALKTYKQELKVPSPLFTRINNEITNMLTYYSSYTELLEIKLFINNIFILPPKKIVDIAILPNAYLITKFNLVEEEKIKITYIDNTHEIKTYNSNDKISINYIDKTEDNIIIKQYKQLKKYSLLKSQNQ
jgi:hypothetical protein